MVFILYNPNARNNHCEQLIDAAKDCFKDEQTSVTDITKIDAKEYIASVSANDKIVICGGDGTLNRFANDTYGADYVCPVYIFKAGTGNDFIRDIAKDENENLICVNEYIKNLPTITINGKTKRYINGIGYGIDGQVCEVADAMKAKGKTNINYAALSIKLLLHGYKCPRAKITVDGVTKEYKRVWLASAMNGRYYGGGMNAAPNQDRKNGLLSSVVLHDSGKIKTLLVFSKIFTGEHVKHTEMCAVTTGKEITVEFSRPTALQIDGETVSGVTKYTATAPVPAKVTV